jgi:hypothetical protein
MFGNEAHGIEKMNRLDPGEVARVDEWGIFRMPRRKILLRRQGDAPMFQIDQICQIFEESQGRLGMKDAATIPLPITGM